MKGMMPMMALSDPAPWEIWWAYVEFEDNPGIGKIRPVLVYQTDGKSLVLSLKMTTHEARPGYAGEYEIIDYAGAGLKKRTVIKCSKAMWLSRSSFRNRIGLLQPMDIMNVMNIMRALDQ